MTITEPPVETPEPAPAAPSGPPQASAPETDKGESLAFFAIGLAALSILTAIFAVGLSVRAVQRADSIENPPAASGPAPVTVELSEFKINPGEITAPAGATLTIKNTGTTPHDFAVGGLMTDPIDAGGEATLDVSSLAPGTYDVVCTVPGHKESGMTATLVVT